MRFALFENAKIEAHPGGSGTCPGCKAPLIAKCGRRKVWHWAHRNQGHCDPWWENETEWHRAWKDRFPRDWQEQPLRGETGELHFADVRTPSGLVIEVQHSYFSDHAMHEREQFYGNLVWIVDGTRLKNDRDHFLEGMHMTLGMGEDPDVYVFNGYGRPITQRWAASERLVCLDFGDDDLWCVSPLRSNWQFFANRVSKTGFIDACRFGPLAMTSKGLPNL